MTEAEKREKLEEGARKSRMEALEAGVNDYGAGLMAMGYRQGWKDRAKLQVEESE